MRHQTSTPGELTSRAIILKMREVTRRSENTCMARVTRGRGGGGYNVQRIFKFPCNAIGSAPAIIARRVVPTANAEKAPATTAVNAVIADSVREACLLDVAEEIPRVDHPRARVAVAIQCSLKSPEVSHALGIAEERPATRTLAGAGCLPPRFYGH
jgi:hypothetical protein